MSYFSKKSFTMRQVVGLLTVVFLGIAVIAYAAVTVPNTFSNGQTISSGQVNQNFTTLGNAMPAVKESHKGQVYTLYRVTVQPHGRGAIPALLFSARLHKTLPRPPFSLTKQSHFDNLLT